MRVIADFLSRTPIATSVGCCHLRAAGPLQAPSVPIQFAAASSAVPPRASPQGGTIAMGAPLDC